MDPLTMGLGLAGVAFQAFGAVNKYQGAQAQTNIQTQMIGTEEQQNAVRKQAMEISARRQQLQQARQAQMAQSMALQNTTKGGAAFGSALGGAQGGIAGASGTNQLSLSQGLQSGEQMFGLENTLDQQKIAYAQAGGQVNLGSALSSVGTGITGNLSTLTNFGKQAGNSLFAPSLNY